MERNSFLFYKSFYEAIKDLSIEVKDEVLTALFEFAFYGIKPQSEDKLINLILGVMIPKLELNNQRYLNGCKGGAPKGSRNNPNGHNQYTKHKEDNQRITKGKPEDNQRITKTTTTQPLCNLLSTNNLQGENAEMQNFGENSDEKRKFSPYNPLIKKIYIKKKIITLKCY